MIGTAIAAAIMTVAVRFGPNPAFIITLNIVPATGIGIWQHLGLRGIVVVTTPAVLFWVAIWLCGAEADFFLCLLIMIITGILLFFVMQCVQRPALRASVCQLLLGTISFGLSWMLLFILCIAYTIIFIIYSIFCYMLMLLS